MDPVACKSRHLRASAGAQSSSGPKPGTTLGASTLIVRCFGAVVALWLAASRFATAETVIEGIPSQPLFHFDHPDATDFSGLVWVGGSDYYAVSDKKKGVFPLRIAVDRSTGEVLSAKFGDMLPLKTKLADFEGITFDSEKRTIYIAAEDGNGILGFGLAKGVAFPLAGPPVFARARDNKGLESLTFDATAGSFWTANEEALEGDGPVSGPDAGTVVRLQKFDRRFKPQAQFTYRTEPSKIRLLGAGTGVSDLAVLPDGELLVLERVAGSFGLSAAIFRVEARSATDVSKLSRLDGATFKPAEKKLLFERATLTNNFEGIALGPKLDDGWHSLILIADSGGGATHYLMPLRIRWSAEK